MATGDIAVRLHDCMGNPVAVQTATWSIPGASGSPTSFSSASDGTACIDAYASQEGGADASTVPATLNLSFCSSPLGVGSP